MLYFPIKYFYIIKMILLPYLNYILSFSIRYTYMSRRNYGEVKRMGGSVSVYDENGKIKTTCDKFCCYRKCRIESMVGGGRCTLAGCVCYESFFVENLPEQPVEGWIPASSGIHR